MRSREFEGGHFHYNSDLSGDVKVSIYRKPEHVPVIHRLPPEEAHQLPNPEDNVLNPEHWVVEIPGKAILDLAWAHFTSQVIGVLEDVEFSDVLVLIDKIRRRLYT